MSADPIILRAALGLFGVELTPHEADVASAYAPRDALLMILADREVAARFDSSHGRPPMDDDVDELLDVYFAIEAKREGA